MASEGQYPKGDGDIRYATETNVGFYGLSQIFLNSTQQWFNTAYKEGGDISGWESKLHGDGVPQWNNIDLNTFQSDSADEAFNLFYNSTDNTYEALDLSSANLVYVDIYATSVNINALTDSANDLYCLKIGDGIWRVYCWKEANDLQNIKRILDKMFTPIGDGATDPNGVTTLTQLRSSYSAYRSKRMYWLKTTADAESDQSASWAFSSSADFTAQSAYLCANSDTGACTSQIQAPDGTPIYSRNSFGPGIIDHRYDNDAGTDVSAETTITFVHDFDSGTFASTTAYSIFITDTSESLSLSSSNMSTTITSGPFDFSAIAPDVVTYPLTEHALTMKTTTSSTINHGAQSINYDIDTTSGIAISLSADSGSNYETGINNGAITKFTNNGTGFWRKYVITRTDNSKEDKITEECGWYGVGSS